MFKCFTCYYSYDRLLVTSSDALVTSSKNGYTVAGLLAVRKNLVNRAATITGASMTGAATTGASAT